MNIQEILEMPAIKAVEIKILDIIMREEHSHVLDDRNNVAIQQLLEIRKQLLDQMFVMTPEYKRLLSDFNDALIKAQLEMRQRLLALHKSVSSQNLGEVEYFGKVFLDYSLPKIHPVQTVRAKKIWYITSGAYDNYMPLYEDGVHGLYLCKNDEVPSENQLLYLSDEVDNWNEGLDRDMTADMHLCYAFHNLYDHTSFSIFDLLWVRDFCIEVSCESSIYTRTSDGDDIDWDKYDYND